MDDYITVLSVTKWVGAQQIQTFLEVEYGNYAKMLEFNIFVLEKYQQVLRHGNVVRSQQLSDLPY